MSIFNKYKNIYSSVEEIGYGPSLEKIEKGTFACCTSPILLNLPQSVQQIGKLAFHGYKSFKTIKLP